MSDVIFSGSKSRSPLNVASVELLFDNNEIKKVSTYMQQILKSNLEKYDINVFMPMPKFSHPKKMKNIIPTFFSGILKHFAEGNLNLVR